MSKLSPTTYPRAHHGRSPGGCIAPILKLKANSRRHGHCGSTTNGKALASRRAQRRTGRSVSAGVSLIGMTPMSLDLDDGASSARTIMAPRGSYLLLVLAADGLQRLGAALPRSRGILLERREPDAQQSLVLSAWRSRGDATFAKGSPVALSGGRRDHRTQRLACQLVRLPADCTCARPASSPGHGYTTRRDMTSAGDQAADARMPVDASRACSAAEVRGFGGSLLVTFSDLLGCWRRGVRAGRSSPGGAAQRRPPHAPTRGGCASGRPARPRATT